MSALDARPEAREALEGWLREHGTLIDAASRQPGARRLHGRGDVFVVPAPGGRPADQWVVRHYHRGGALAGLLGDRYPRLAIPRPFRELLVLRSLVEADIPTATPVGAAVYPFGPWYRGDLVTQWIPGSEDLGRALFGADSPGGRSTGSDDREGVRAMAAAGALVRLLHERGLDHPDLNLKNILVRPDEDGVRAFIIDLDRASIRKRLGEGRKRRMLRRFERSLEKWERRAGVPAPQGALESFRRGYATGGPGAQAGEPAAE